MSSYLPVPAFWWFPEAHGDGPRRIVVPAGTSVHAARSGRVTQVDDQAVGAVVVRDHDERFHHYRRLRASSITVDESDEIEAGTVLGYVATPNDDSVPALLYGVHDAEDRWLDAGELLVGAGDPAPLALLAEPVGDGATPAEPVPAPMVTVAPPPVPTATAAPEPVERATVGADDEVEGGDVDVAPERLAAGPEAPLEPTRETPVAAAVDDDLADGDADEPAEAEPEPKRSRLAARRPPRRST